MLWGVPLGVRLCSLHVGIDYPTASVSTPASAVTTAESFFALVKRGINGTFHAVSRKHLHRYMGEFGFRWNSRKVCDGDRVALAVQGAEGKRLMYREPTGKIA